MNQTQNQSAHKRPIRAKIILALASLVLSLGMGEGALRLCGYVPHTEGMKEYYDKEIITSAPGLPYVFRPNVVIVEQWPNNPNNYFRPGSNTLVFRTNNAGFRGRDFSLERNRNVRIAVIGDSFCWGQGVKDQDLFTTRLEGLLDGSTLFNGEFEVYNFGLSSYNTDDEVALFKSIALKYRPDVCVIWFYINDFAFNRELGKGPNPVGNNLLVRYRRKSFLLDALITPLDNWLTNREMIRLYHQIYADNSLELARGREFFREFSSLCRQNQVVPVLAVHPYLTDLNDRYPFRFIHEKVMAAAWESGINAVDLFPCFRGRDAKSLWVHPTDPHPNQTAHALAADCFFDYLHEILEKNESLIEESRSLKSQRGG